MRNHPAGAGINGVPERFRRKEVHSLNPRSSSCELRSFCSPPASRCRHFRPRTRSPCSPEAASGARRAPSRVCPASSPPSPATPAARRWIPTYEQVSTGRTGHAESAQVTFDPAKISYQKLLEVYWHNIDPTQKDGQFCDHGSQYRTAIFYTSEAQKTAALASKAKLEQEPRFKGRIVTEIVPLTKFYTAEEYHQDYCKVNPLRYTAYYKGCGREARLKEIWGDAAGGHK